MMKDLGPIKCSEINISNQFDFYIFLFSITVRLFTASLILTHGKEEVS